VNRARPRAAPSLDDQSTTIIRPVARRSVDAPIGAERARQMVARATRSYFEINDQPINGSERVNASAMDQAVVFSQPLPVTQLNQLLSANLMAAWLADRGGAVRYGFWMSLDAVRKELRTYGNNCAQVAKQAGSSKN